DLVLDQEVGGIFADDHVVIKDADSPLLDDTGSNSRASPPSICIPLIRLNKPVLASVPTPDGARMSYVANVNEPSISPDGGQPTGQFFPARPKRQRQQIYSAMRAKKNAFSSAQDTRVGRRKSPSTFCVE
ncbi:MAG: hypothetical protein QOD93_2773, partial [Acetobacteraceae bacterium]|nr:hypothetical protein [Acetobacteraceae bacterium]